jgi:hypothetical protein
VICVNVTVQAGEELDDEIFYTDKRGGRDHECLSLGCDNEPVLAGRTPVQTYADFVSEFAEQCKRNGLWGALLGPFYPVPVSVHAYIVWKATVMFAASVTGV